MPPKDLTYPDLVKAGDEAVKPGEPDRRRGVLPPGAGGSTRTTRTLWLKLANVVLTAADAAYTAQNSSDMYDQGATASYAALMAFLQTQDSRQGRPRLGARRPRRTRSSAARCGANRS